MKRILTCLVLVCAGALASADEPRTGAEKSIDGTWTVLCAEKDGRPMGEAKDITVTVKDNVFTVRGKDGKEMKLKVEFAGQGRAKVTEENTASSTNTDATKTDRVQGAKAAVYVLTADYLSICVHGDKAEGDVKPAAATEAGQASGKSYCSFVLKRADGERK